jgi:hypothetical protein
MIVMFLHVCWHNQIKEIMMVETYSTGKQNKKYSQNSNGKINILLIYVPIVHFTMLSVAEAIQH